MRICHLLACLGLFALSAPVHAQAFTDVTVGKHHVCALDTAGTANCTTQPFAIRFDTPEDLPAFSAIAAGHQHTCGITLAGEAVCWGDNVFNELDVPDIDAPLMDITAGTNHTCAVDINNRGWCWGLDTNEQTQVPGNGLGQDGTGFVRIETSANASCGIQPAGNITCWSTDTSVTDTSSLTGRFVDLAINQGSAGTMGCGLRDTGTIQCWTANHQLPPADGPYTDLVVSPAAICGLNENQLLDCSARSSGSSIIGDLETGTQFNAIESGELFFSGDLANVCGVTVAGEIECLAVLQLPEPPGSPDAPSGAESIELDLVARVYSRSTVELFWTDIGGFPNTQVEIYRDNELLAVTDALRSWLDDSVPAASSVTYSVRAIDVFGGTGPFSRTVTVDIDNLTVGGDDNIISNGSVVSPAHTVGAINVSVIAGQLHISWQGSVPESSTGLQGYEVRVNNEVVSTTRALVHIADEDAPELGCTIISIAAISDDDAIIDFNSRIFRRAANGWSDRC